MYVFIQSPFNIAVPTLTVTPSVAYNCPRLLRQSNIVLSVLGGFRIPWTTRDPPFTSLSHSCPCCPEDHWEDPGMSKEFSRLSGHLYNFEKPAQYYLHYHTFFKLNYNQVLKVCPVKPTFPELLRAVKDWELFCPRTPLIKTVMRLFTAASNYSQLWLCSIDYDSHE